MCFVELQAEQESTRALQKLAEAQHAGHQAERDRAAAVQLMLSAQAEARTAEVHIHLLFYTHHVVVLRNMLSLLLQLTQVFGAGSLSDSGYVSGSQSVVAQCLQVSNDK